MVEVIVEYDYTAKEPDELSIKKGDVIKDVIKKQGGWWEGVLNDQKGMFPDNFVRPMDPSVNLRNKKDVTRIRQCRVVFSYNQDHEDELNLSVGDVINIVGEEEEGWWRGNLNGKEGVFPSNFVEEIIIQPPKPKPNSREDLRGADGDAKVPKLPAKPVKQLCEAKYPYKAQNEDELSFKENDIITLVSKDSQDPGWWKGELNGKIGVFPDNFVSLIPQTEEGLNSYKEEKKSKIVTETGAIKPSSIASQRKSLEVKTDKTHLTDTANVNSSKTPPPPGKKPLTAIKKSPSASGLFSDIKKKIVDAVDGATGSKVVSPKIEPVEIRNGGENAFDQVERRPLLTDPRATRAKPPGRRLPKSIHKDDDVSIPNGNADHLLDRPESPVAPPNSSPSEIDGDKPKLREWEKHRAPWLEEMKLNQAKRTSTSPGPETKLKLSPTSEKNAEPEESLPSKASPVEKEPDMSKSMPPMDLSKALSTAEKPPAMRAKPNPSPVSSSRTLLPNSVKEAPPAARHTFNVAKETASKPAAPGPPKMLKSPSTAHKPPLVEKPTLVPKAIGDVEETHPRYAEVLERIQKLEVTVEKQNRAIEELSNRLRVETDMRMMLQEKVSQNVQV